MSDISDVYERAVIVAKGWARLRPGKSFFGMTLEDFRNLIAPSGAARAKLLALEKQTQSVMAQRDEADKVTRRGTLRVVNAVKGDPAEGEDSELIGAMGYVPHTARTSIVAAARRNASKAAQAADVSEEEEVEEEA